MSRRRASGILLHPTSLPGRFGIGDLGAEACRFADFLAGAGQRVWQVLPLGPTGFGDSPYQLFSAFAGNPLLISLEGLVEEGWLDAADVASPPPFPEETVDYAAAMRYKLPLLRRAAENFAARPDNAEFDSFCRENALWLDDYAAFMALKQANGGEAVWTQWTMTTAPALEIAALKFAQFVFYRQWRTLHRYAHGLGIRMMGDLPIYVAHDSADVWAHRDLFQLDESGNPVVVSGVPPDYFSATGQLWGNPIYRWDLIDKNGYRWWIERLRAALGLVDMVRIDHFRGFEAYWEVPARETTAVKGRWVKGPGAALFEALRQALGELPIVAENLGVITPEVEAIRTRFGFPGMAVLQFAFGSDLQAPDFRPHNYTPDLVAYSGTHDNDTTVGWWTSTGGDSTRTEDEIRKERDYARRYLNTTGSEINWAFIRALIASVADTVLFPMQDVLGLGSEARMNVPSVPGGNWRWRMRPGALTASAQNRLKSLTELYER